MAPIGLKSSVARTKYVRGGAEVWNTYMYLSSGRGRKSGGARATGATPSLAPLVIALVIPF